MRAKLSSNFWAANNSKFISKQKIKFLLKYLPTNNQQKLISLPNKPWKKFHQLICHTILMLLCYYAHRKQLIQQLLHINKTWDINTISTNWKRSVQLTPTKKGKENLDFLCNSSPPVKPTSYCRTHKLPISTSSTLTYSNLSINSEISSISFPSPFSQSSSRISLTHNFLCLPV